MDENPNFFSERGQSLVIIALIMVALIAMLALVLDGGNTYFQRRNAQNAADAAALAGANAYCKDNSYASGYAAAQNYANLNGFDLPLANFSVVVTPTAQINVTTTKTFDTYFGGVIGWPQMTVEAQAASSCCTILSAEHIMPIAWACHRPNAFNQPYSSSTDCVSQVISETKLTWYLNGTAPYPYPYSNSNGVPYQFYDELYIVMDSSSEPDDLSTICWQYDSNGNIIDINPATPGYYEGMDCDFDNDGENDLISNGDRSWVDLDGGGGGADDLKSWVVNGLNSPLSLPVWVDGQPGVANATFHEIDNLKNNFFLIPVFDAICPGNPANTSTCPPFNNEPVIEYQTNGYTYRLVTFAVFYITCVYDGGAGSCPGHDYMVDNIATLDPNGTSGFKTNTKTIEGYFVDKDLAGNYNSDCTGGGLDLGAYVTRLTR